jgi:UDP-glucose 4-epimerase
MVAGRSSSRKILVTGAAGFMGSHLAAQLLMKGWDVVALDDLSGGFVDNVPAGASFVEGSVQDAALLTRLFEEHRFRHVFHLAAYAAEGLSHFIRRFNYQNNLIGSINLINLAVLHEIERFVFTSSIAVYGAGQLPMVEDMDPSPEDPYGVAKYAVELDLRAAHEMFGLDYTIFRPHNVYGEHQNIGDRYRNVIGIFMNQVFQGKPLTVFGDGEQSRAFSYISDVIAPMVACLDIPETAGQVFNVGADTPFTVNQLVRAVANAMETKVEVTHLEARNEVVHAYADHSKLRRFFPDLPPPVPLDDGLRRMAAWARRRGPQKTKRFAAVEVAKNMPDSWRKDFMD